jgi:hypothetical protein
MLWWVSGTAPKGGYLRGFAEGQAEGFDPLPDPWILFYRDAGGGPRAMSRAEEPILP